MVRESGPTSEQKEKVQYIEIEREHIGLGNKGRWEAEKRLNELKEEKDNKIRIVEGSFDGEVVYIYGGTSTLDLFPRRGMRSTESALKSGARIIEGGILVSGRGPQELALIYGEPVIIKDEAGKKIDRSEEVLYDIVAYRED